MVNSIKVVPGQVWEDLDKRRVGRLFRVQSVKNDLAHIMPVAGGCKCTSIKLNRFIPKYYRLTATSTTSLPTINWGALTESTAKPSLAPEVISLADSLNANLEGNAQPPHWSSVGNSKDIAFLTLRSFKVYLRRFQNSDKVEKFQFSLYFNKTLLVSKILDSEQLIEDEIDEIDESLYQLGSLVVDSLRSFPIVDESLL